MTSLKARIYNYLKAVYDKAPDKWISGRTIEDLSRTCEKQHKASYGAREVRRLFEEDGLIDRQYVKGYVEYRYKPTGAIDTSSWVDNPTEEVETPVIDDKGGKIGVVEANQEPADEYERAFGIKWEEKPLEPYNPERARNLMREAFERAKKV